MKRAERIGIVGGTGMLGSAIIEGLLSSGTVTAETISVLSRSGQPGFLARHPGLDITTDADRLCENCGTLLLAVPPAAAATLRLPAADHLVLSVMAGVTRDRLSEITGSHRVVRAMSSPAAALGLAYTPWVASDGVTAEDRHRTTALFGAIGLTDALDEEAHLDHFTALTGPVPGFVAFFADAMTAHAETQGIPPEAADWAIRQLFLAAGRMMAEDTLSPAGHVRQMIDYAGTTAAGLQAMEDSPIRGLISEGLAAAAAKAREIG